MVEIQKHVFWAWFSREFCYEKLGYLYLKSKVKNLNLECPNFEIFEKLLSRDIIQIIVWIFLSYQKNQKMQNSSSKQLLAILTSKVNQKLKIEIKSEFLWHINTKKFYIKHFWQLLKYPIFSHERYISWLRMYYIEAIVCAWYQECKNLTL